MIVLFFVIVLVVLIPIILWLPRWKRPQSVPANRFTRSDSHPQQRDGRSTSQAADVGFRSTTVEPVPILPEYRYTSISDGTLPTAMADLSEEVREENARRIKSLPALPTTSIELEKLLKDPNSCAKDVAALVSTNPVLSARLLRAINSAYFNLPEKTNSVGRAIVLMGYNNVRSAVMYDNLRSILPSHLDRDQSLRDQLWVHSTVVSASAHYISRHMLRTSEHEMATIGLLHDIGKCFLGLSANDEPRSKSSSVISQEEGLFGTNHAVLGGLIAQNWDLSEQISNCIAYHHHPAYVAPDEIPEAYRRSSAIVYLADLVCRVLGYRTESDELLSMRSEYYELLGLEAELSSVATRGLTREIEKAHATVQSYICGR